MGGKPFPDGEEPDSHGHGGADDPFASVVFDEDFVRSAVIHEPSAAERILAADRARAEADAARARPAAGSAEDDLCQEPHQGPLGAGELPGLTHDLDPDDAYGPYGRYGSWRRPYRGRARWHRPVAWVLAMVMGIGVIALAFAAVYRSASSGERRDRAAGRPALGPGRLKGPGRLRRNTPGLTAATRGSCRVPARLPKRRETYP